MLLYCHVCYRNLDLAIIYSYYTYTIFECNSNKYEFCSNIVHNGYVLYIMFIHVLTWTLFILDNIELTSSVKHSLCINVLSDNYRSKNHFVQNLAHQFNTSTILYNQLIINITYFVQLLISYIIDQTHENILQTNFHYSLTYINY